MEENIESFISPVCFHWNVTDPGFNLSPGKMLSATGWGRTSTRENKTENDLNYAEYNANTDTLEKVDLPLLSQESCLQYFPRMNQTLQLCAGAEIGKLVDCFLSNIHIQVISEQSVQSNSSLVRVWI